MTMADVAILLNMGRFLREGNEKTGLGSLRLCYAKHPRVSQYQASGNSAWIVPKIGTEGVSNTTGM